MSAGRTCGSSAREGDISPRKLAIEVNADDKSNTEPHDHVQPRRQRIRTLSPDEYHAVLVIHGQLFLTKTPSGGKCTRLTEHAFADSGPTWSPDGKKILFASRPGAAASIFTCSNRTTPNTRN